MENLFNNFKNKELLRQALTHKSWVNEHPNVIQSNERLEFLGDAVLEFIVSSILYQKFPNEEEGYLTALRSNLVNTTNLSKVALRLKIGEAIQLSKGEEETGGRNNPSILADTVEAIIGAIYLDSGIETAKKFIEENITNNLEEKIKQPLKDPKSLLQEIVQAKDLPAPKYQVIKEEGPDHAKIFTVEVIFDSKVQAIGKGKNKSEAEQEAAKIALNKINQQ